ncbi:hypothetical protein AB0940_33460 [Streptomyces sp. NPDC006656]|uniref:hypothetical protein n=1 Tax=Streptomyces sp. NPDC006656 TaxID=3156899 RepID=UPI003455C5F0
MDRISMIATAAAEDACGLCGYWTCRCGGDSLTAQAVTAAVPTDSDPDMEEALRRAKAGR